MTSFFKKANGTLAFDDSGGKGETVLMLPGMGALRSEYRYLVPALAQNGYRTVTMDLRGQGESSVPWEEYTISAVGEDILDLLNHLGVSSAHIVATSFSPAPAVWTAIQKPEVVKSLVLISPFLHDEKLSLAKTLSMDVLLHGPWKVSAWVSYYKTLYPIHKPDDFDEYLSQLSDNLKEKGRFEAAMALGSQSKSEIESRLSMVKQPTLVIFGTCDPDWSDPIREAHLVADKLSGELLLVEGAGHYPQTEMPHKVNSKIVEFIKKV